jgi:regulator of extracellular matrix RemA (YlzA/DUF370 family)
MIELARRIPRKQSVVLERNGRRVVLSNLRLSQRYNVDIDPEGIIAILDAADPKVAVHGFFRRRQEALAAIDATHGHKPLSVVVTEDNRAFVSASSSGAVANSLLGRVRAWEEEEK